MPCPAPTGLSLRVRSQKRITLEILQWRFPSGCFYFSWCRLQQAYRASLTGLAYSQTLREHCSTRSLLFSWSCLSWVLLSIDRADPLIPATFVAGCKASVAAKRRLEGAEELSTFHKRTMDSLRIAFGVFISGDVGEARKLLADKARCA